MLLDQSDAARPCPPRSASAGRPQLGFSLPAAKTRWIGRLMTAPSATRITAPSPISAVLSATAASSVSKVLPTWLHLRIAFGERVCHAADGQARFGRQIGQLRREGAVDEHQPPAIDAGKDARRLLGARLGRRIGRRRQRIGLAHQRAQIGVFPFLDAPVRQAGGVETRERRPRAAWRRRPCPAACRVRPRKRRRSACSAEVLIARTSAFITPPRPRIARSPWPRARAPAPCRPTSPRGPWPSRARRPARCSSAAADNA